MAEEIVIDHEGNLGLLALSKSADNFYEIYRKNLSKEEGDLVEPLKALESIVSEGNEIAEGSFMNATPQAIESVLQEYHKKNKESREKAIKESGEYIANEYIQEIESNLGKIVKEILQKEKGLDELSKEDQAKAIGPYLYMQIAGGLIDLEINEKELDDELKALKELSEAKDEDQKNNSTKNYLQTKGIGYMASVINYQDAPKKASSMLRRILAKKMLKQDEEGNYVLDRKTFQKIYGNEESYKKLAMHLKLKEQEKKEK